MQVVYGTHATSEHNVAGIASGHSDPDLAPQAWSSVRSGRRRKCSEGDSA